MSMPMISDLREEAQSLGIEGEAIAQFVLSQQQIFREERAKDRELEKQRLDALEKQKQREHEVRLAELQHTATQNDSVFNDSVARPKLPVFKDGEDITSFFTRFERIATLLRINPEHYAVRVGTLLSGRAVDIYSTLTPDITGNYQDLKKALLRGFNKTPETYRAEFRSMKIKPAETYEQFAAQLGRSLDYWTESKNLAKTYEHFRAFIIIDQFLASVPSELRLHIKEHNVETLQEVVKLADNWASARNAYPKKQVDPENTISNAKPVARENSNRNRFPTQRDWSSIKCHGCGAYGHIKSKCPKNPAAFVDRFRSDRDKVSFCNTHSLSDKYKCDGTINGTAVSNLIRDTGCSRIIVADRLLPEAKELSTIEVSDYLGRENEFPVVKTYVDCKYFRGWADLVKAPLQFADALIGNVEGVLDNPINDDSAEEAKVAAVTTRAASKFKALHPLVVPEIQPIDVSPEKFADLQQTCDTLKEVRRQANDKEETVTKDGSRYLFSTKNKLLYRTCLASKHKILKGRCVLVAPKECRRTILVTAHESTFAGHFSHRKTEMKIKQQFYWPMMTSDIRDFCRSCDKCQRVSPKGRVKPVPLVKMPIITEPFSRVAMDLVGPISPPAEGGQQYILTLIDVATGFPEAIPLKEITSIAVAEALMLIFSRVGIPKEILSDRGTQFTSQLMGELHRLLGVKPLFTTPYHPMCTGRIERVHSTMKACLKKLCSEKPKDWPRYLIPTLFALREIPSDRSGYSAFELLYGRQVRGPLTVLRDLWEDASLGNEQRTAFQYVLDLQKKLEDCSRIAAENSRGSVERYKQYFDVKSQNRQFNANDEVLVLLPDSSNKLLMAWKGPFRVIERRNRVNYLIDEKGAAKLYHANILKKYYRRETAQQAALVSSMIKDKPSEALLLCQNCVISADEEEPVTSERTGGEIYTIPTDEDEVPDISPHLNQDQTAQLQELLAKFDDVLSTLPGNTQTIQHEINLQTVEPFRNKVYPIPLHLKEDFEKEVDKLLELGIIRPSNSPYCSPCVLVQKPDNSYRLTIDYRQLNARTAFVAEPPCCPEEDLPKFANARYFSEIDLCKAYYQVNLTENAIPLTAFATQHGLMEFTRMSFGLVGAPATYIKLMRQVLRGLPNVAFYFDNIFVYSEDWETHVTALHNVFHRLREHHLTARPSKCRLAYENMSFLGFEISHNQLKPQDQKIQAIASLPQPQTKKLMRSFLGMVSFYRKFIPNAAQLTAPLTDLLKKEAKEPLIFTEEASRSFDKLKLTLSSNPILRLPDHNLPFVVRTDASNRGIGCMLLQYHDNTPHPIAYASRKLLDRETRYSTIEKECLAIIYGINKFKFYLLGCEFILEVDHRPLVYLNRTKGNNARLMRWALSLQPFRYRIVYIPGSLNVGADLLSRC